MLEEERPELIAYICGLISDYGSNPDEIRHHLNILYPDIVEFQTPFPPTPHNRSVLIGHLAHRLYMQLCIGTSSHPYNDIISFKEVAFAHIENLVPELEQSMQQRSYQEYVGFFIQYFSQGIIVSAENLELWREILEACYNDPSMNHVYKLRYILEVSAKILMLKLLLPIVNGTVILPDTETENTANTLYNLLGAIIYPEAEPKTGGYYIDNNGLRFMIFEDDFETFCNLATKFNEESLIDKCIYLGARLSASPAYMARVEALVPAIKRYPLLIKDRQLDPQISTPLVLIAADKEYNSEEVNSKIIPNIQALSACQTNLQVEYFGCGWTNELRVCLAERLAKLQKNSGKYSEKAVVLDNFIHGLQSPIEVWCEILQNENIHKRLKKTIIEKIISYPLDEYIQHALVLQLVPIARTIYDLGAVNEIAMFNNLEERDIAAVFNDANLKARIVNQDGSNILHLWLHNYSVNSKLLSTILSRYYRASFSELCNMRHADKDFIQELALASKDVQVAACAVLIEHPACGPAVLGSALKIAIKAGDHRTTRMICDYASLDIDAELLFCAINSAAAANSMEILVCLCTEYAAQCLTNPDKKPLSELQVDGLDLLATALFRSKNTAYASYLLSINFRVDAKYFVLGLNLAQITLLRTLDSGYNCAYALEILKLLCSKTEDLKLLLSARAKDGYRCLEMAVLIPSAIQSQQRAEYAELYAYLLAQTPHTSESSTQHFNLLHLCAQLGKLDIFQKTVAHLYAVEGYGVVYSMLGQKDLKGHTPLALSTVNTHYVKVGAANEMANLIIETIRVCQPHAKSDLLALNSWARDTPEDFAKLDTILVRIFGPMTTDKRELKLDSTLLAFKDENCKSFLDQLLAHPMPVIHSALAHIFDKPLLSLHLIIFLTKDGAGDNFYIKVEKMADSLLVMRLLQELLAVLINKLIVNHPEMLLSIASTHDFFNIKGSNPLIAKLIESQEYSKIHEFVCERVAFRKRICQELGRGLAERNGMAECPNHNKMLDTLIKAIINPIFKRNELVDVKYAGLPLYKCLHEKHMADPENKELSNIITSPLFQDALSLRPVTDLEEWQILIKDQELASIDPCEYSRKMYAFKRCVDSDKLQIDALDANGDSALFVAAEQGIVLLTRFLVEDCNVEIGEQLMAAILAAARNIDCLDYLTLKYQQSNSVDDCAIADMLCARSEELFREVALRDKDFIKLFWVISHGADPIALGCTGFNILHTVINTLKDPGRILTIEQAIQLIGVILRAAPDRAALMAKKDHYGYTCLEELLIIKVDSQYVRTLSDLATLFLNNGVGVDNVSIGQQNILHLVCAGMPEMARFIVDYIKSKFGAEKLCEMLNARALHNRTPLHFAVISNVELVLLFLENGADPLLEDDMHMTPKAYCRNYHAEHLHKREFNSSTLRQIENAIDTRLLANKKNKKKLRA